MFEIKDPLFQKLLNILNGKSTTIIAVNCNGPCKNDWVVAILDSKGFSYNYAND